MAIIEQDFLFRYIDANGNQFILYPVTRADLLDGVVSVENGGTGAATAAGALASLGALALSDFTFSTTDPGAGSAATTKFFAVYEE